MSSIIDDLDVLKQKLSIDLTKFSQILSDRCERVKLLSKSDKKSIKIGARAAVVTVWCDS